MKLNATLIFGLSMLFISTLSSPFLSGQELINNGHSEIIKLPTKKVLIYFKYFNSKYISISDLEYTKMDSMAQNGAVSTLYFTEDKIYNAADIATNLATYQKLIKRKPAGTNLAMLLKASPNAETRKSPIKPMLFDNLSQKGMLQWKIEVEPVDEQSTKLTFIFNSLNKTHKKKFIRDFTKGIDDYYDYSIEKIYITEAFSKDILKYLKENASSDALDVPPGKSGL